MPSKNSPSKIVIVGGGTSGWSAAALLSKFDRFDVVVVEPVDNEPIGVGESTLPVINDFHRATGIDVLQDTAWVDRVDGTAKFSIEFANFYKLDGVWTHPFVVTQSNDVAFIDAVSNGLVQDASGPHQYRWFSENLELGSKRLSKFHRTSDIAPYSGYAYHLDASKYAKLLKDESLKRGCRIVQDTVQNVERDGDDITALVLSSGETLEADLFVDCTGFKRLLSTSDWISYSDRMLCDRAAAVQLPYVDREAQERNTTYCHALSSGWVWNVPLQSRVGTGYVFSSKYLSDDDAITEIRVHLAKTYGYDYESVNPRIVQFESGRVKDAWKGNVVTIGLSQMFIEPIESTAIALTQLALLDLEPLIDAHHVPLNIRQKRFNKKVSDRSEVTLEFCEAHYSLSKRDDSPFWRAYKNKGLSEVQTQLLKTFVSPKQPLNDDALVDYFEFLPFFGHVSWVALFSAYGFTAPKSSPDLSFADERLKICSSCENLSGAGVFKKCKLCGCFMEAKARLRGASCPMGLW